MIRLLIPTILWTGLYIALGGATGATDREVARLTPEEKRGKQIYRRGVSKSGLELTAFLGDAGLEVPASTLTCAGCHGNDGRGRPEGGVAPTNLSWELLSRPYGVNHPGGRKHPAYTDVGLELAITRGIDPGGNRLSNAMPRYEMSEKDLAALIAYLKRVGQDADPGIWEGAVRLGLILPEDDGEGSGAAVRSALEAYFAEVNESGGVYDRRLELEVPDFVRGSNSLDRLESFVTEGDVFALVSPFIDLTDARVAEIIRDEEIPIVGPLSHSPGRAPEAERFIFYLLPGRDEQVRSLARFAAEQQSSQPRSVFVVYPDRQPELVRLAELARTELEMHSIQPRLVTHQGETGSREALVEALSVSESPIAILLQNAGEVVEITSRLTYANVEPTILIPGSMIGSDILRVPRDFRGQIHLAFPSLPSDQSEAALVEFARLSARHGLERRRAAVQMTAMASAKLIVESLKRVGRDLSREKFIESLESLYEYDTGLTPRLTFGPNRRVGARGAHIVNFDPSSGNFRPARAWLELK